jgi:hypothetical protein
MKSWHIVVMDGWKTIKDVTKFDVKEARELEKKLKDEYAALKEADPQTPTANYVVKREWY